MSYIPECPWVVFKADKLGPAPSHINRLVCKPCTYIKTSIRISQCHASLTWKSQIVSKTQAPTSFAVIASSLEKNIQQYQRKMLYPSTEIVKYSLFASHGDPHQTAEAHHVQMLGFCKSNNLVIPWVPHERGHNFNLIKDECFIWLWQQLPSALQFSWNTLYFLTCLLIKSRLAPASCKKAPVYTLRVACDRS